MHGITMNTPIGRLYLAADEKGIREIRLLGEGEQAVQTDICDTLRDAAGQLSAYFSGERTSFSLQMHADGTAFERGVWDALAGIPYGEVRSYGEIAAQLGKPAASRAVGRACARNPLLIVVPCHRVVSATGRLTGFAAGLDAKRTLLALEGWRIEGDRLRR